MAFTVQDYQDLTRLLREHPEWREEWRRLVLSEELLGLPEIVRRLALAQERTEERLNALTEQVRRLTESQARLTESQARLTEGQQRLSERQDRFTQALEQLTEQVRLLTEGQQRLTERQDRFTQALEQLTEQVRLLTEGQQRLTEQVVGICDSCGNRYYSADILHTVHEIATGKRLPERKEEIPVGHLG